MVDKPLVLIPARGGSKRLPGKNIKEFKGKPLIIHSLNIAKQIFPIEDIVLSTDDLTIIDVAQKYGFDVHFKRPDYLASDLASTRDVILHALDFFEHRNYKEVVLLQPTSPLRNSLHIKESMELWQEGLDMVVSVKKVNKNFKSVIRTEENGYLKPFSCNETNYWELNGAIYIICSKSLKQNEIANFSKVKKYEMSDIESIDIDTQLDWDIAEVFSNYIKNGND